MDTYEPSLGDYLGDLTDELNGDTIEQFISAGPKQYAYRLAQSGGTVCKVRGFTLNFSASKKINFDSMKSLVMNEGPRRIVVQDDRIVRDMTKLEIHNKVGTKVYQQVFTKRVMGRDFNTYPHGYIKR